MTFRGELLRKGTHIVALIVPFMFLQLKRSTALWLVSIGAVVALLQDILRIYNKGFRRFLYRAVGEIYRRWEMKRLGGASYILIAGALSLFLFDEKVAALSMVFIIVGDTAAVFIGTKWGKHALYKRRNPDSTIRKKTIEGTAAFLVSSLMASLFVPGIPPLWKVVGAFIATAVEVGSYFIDDNFSVPIITGMVLQVGIYGKLVMSVR